MKPKKKKTKKVKSPNSKRKSKSKIQVLSNEEVATIEKLGIDLGAGLSKKELAAIKKAGIDLRADGEKFWKSPQGISIKASAEGKPDPNAVRINVFDEAKKVKNFSQLERFIEKYSPGIDAALAAHILTKYTRDNWNVIKILKEPDCHGAILELIDEISKRDRGARIIWQEYQLNTQHAETIDESDGALAKFSILTGYVIPNTDKTFQEHVSMFKNHFGLKRKKKKVPLFKDVEFKI